MKPKFTIGTAVKDMRDSRSAREYPYGYIYATDDDDAAYIIWGKTIEEAKENYDNKDTSISNRLPFNDISKVFPNWKERLTRC